VTRSFTDSEGNVWTSVIGDVQQLSNDSTIQVRLVDRGTGSGLRESEVVGVGAEVACCMSVAAMTSSAYLAWLRR
jgi:hypothetical protein